MEIHKNLCIVTSDLGDLQFYTPNPSFFLF